MPQKRVFVYESEDTLVVYPPLIVLNSGDSLVLVNGTDENLDWDVPAGVFGPNPHQEKVNQKGNSTAKNPHNVATASTYQVKGRSTKKKGKGNSDPVIIIDL